MKVLKHILLGILIAITLVGSAGIHVYKHFCHQDGLQIGFLEAPDAHCTKEIAHHASQEVAIPTCCTKPVIQENPNEKTFKSNCCTSEVESFKINFDYSNSFALFEMGQVPNILAYKAPFTTLIGTAPIEDLGTCSYYNRPPPKYKKPLFIQHASYLI